MDDSSAIIFDTGTSKSMTFDPSDFIGTIQSPSLDTLAGLSEKTQVKEEGHIKWKVRDNYGHIQTIETDAYYVPAACICLFSPQTYFQGRQQGCASFDHEAFVFHFDGTSLPTLTLLYNKGSNLPLAHLEHECDDLGESAYPRTIIDPVVDEANVNLTQHKK
eukprot:5104254-Ditylum_brightwellii.AAC.1